jgi:hypothetical protein
MKKKNPATDEVITPKLMEGLLWYINPYDDGTDLITLKDYKNNFSNFSPSVLTHGNIIPKQEKFEKLLILF